LGSWCEPRYGLHRPTTRPPRDSADAEVDGALFEDVCKKITFRDRDPRQG
jgi:hypothetical protein